MGKSKHKYYTLENPFTLADKLFDLWPNYEILDKHRKSDEERFFYLASLLLKARDDVNFEKDEFSKIFSFNDLRLLFDMDSLAGTSCEAIFNDYSRNLGHRFLNNNVMKSFNKRYRTFLSEKKEGYEQVKEFLIELLERIQTNYHVPLETKHRSLSEVIRDFDFIPLPKPQINVDEPGSFYLATQAYERFMEIAGMPNISIAGFENNLTKNQLENAHKAVPYFSFRLDSFNILEELASIGGLVRTPHAMKIKDVHELEDHIIKIYQVSFFHYILGKHYSDDFPRNYCGFSGRNLAISMMCHGYTNAVYAYNKEHDHGYTMFPFVLEHPHLEGVIVADPSSDQLWENIEDNSYKPRNMVFVEFGAEWDYRAFWADFSNLFPQKIFHLSLLRKYIRENGAIYVEKNFFARSKWMFSYGKKFLDSAFKRPVELYTAKK